MVPDIQHGFRKYHTIIWALCNFNEDIAASFNKPKPPDQTLRLQIELSKAIGKVLHKKNDERSQQDQPAKYLKRWFATYLLGRQS